MKSRRAARGVVTFHTEYRKSGTLLPNTRALREVVKKIFIHARRPLERLDAIYINDKRMKELHGRFLKTKETTDVITFSLGEAKRIIAEVYISLDMAASNALDYVESFEREVARLVIHGALHLTGENDKTRTEQKSMRAAEEKYLGMYERLKANN